MGSRKVNCTETEVECWLPGAERRGGEGVWSEEQRDEMGECERTDEFV